MKNKKLVVILLCIAVFVIALGLSFQFIINYEKTSDKKENGNDSSLNSDQSSNNNDNDSPKVVVCSYTSNSGSIKTTETYTFNHINNKLKGYSIVLKFEYSNESQESVLRYKGDSIKRQVEAARNVDGIDITHKDENYVITNSYNYDLVKYNSFTSLVSSNIRPIYNLDDSVSVLVEKVKSWQFSCNES